MLPSRRRFPFWNLIFLALLGLIIYLEVVVYFIAYHQWPKLNGWSSYSNVTKVLFVSDPQILGEDTEGWLARWDCDRYLRNTFSVALRYARPSCVVFLGDLMDEGSVGTEDQWDRYFERFKRIFKLDQLNKGCSVFIPGDNDIGGENENINFDKLEMYKDRFRDHYDIVDYKNLRFLKVNKILNTAPTLDDVEDNDGVRIILSHIPLIGYDTSFSEKVISSLKPHIIISGHEHDSLHLVADETGHRTLIEELKTNHLDSSSWRFILANGLINEIIVPTCSYRMGTEGMAFGLAEIETNEKIVNYYVLWLPKRLSHLLVYLYALITLGLLLCMVIFQKCMVKLCYLTCKAVMRLKRR